MLKDSMSPLPYDNFNTLNECPDAFSGGFKEDFRGVVCHEELERLFGSWVAKPATRQVVRQSSLDDDLIFLQWL